ncbi:S1C family serine protease [Pseudoteredinibacter isoporae]|uniref:S1C family serine protease n=1 Tax=Pseudoteredinibacter isoporae TaxID=570281 RepID=UPI0033425F47
MFSRRIAVVLVSMVSLLLAVSAQASLSKDYNKVKNAVIKIYSTLTPPDYFTPWRLLNSQQSSGSGAVISGNRILTNAHVIADASYLQVQKNGQPKKYLAHVDFVSHEADLAILKVEDESFFDGITPLKVGKLPEPLETVSVFGYPFGGNTLSITQGVLSRVEHQFYAHAGGYLLAGQIDAAINPGNSGGPVIAGNKIVGVVMQANTGARAENLGYFVPPSVIRHILKDADDAEHNGFVNLGLRTQSLESPALRAAHQLKDGESGALIVKVFEGSASEGKLFPGDVILTIDDHDVAEDRSIEFRKNQRTNFKYALDQRHVGDKITLNISRQGEKQTVEIIAAPSRRNYSLVLAERFGQQPSYFIYGGVVFVPLNMNLIKRWGSNWHSKAPIDFLSARGQWRSPEKTELVVALKVLPADVNLGFHDWKNWIIESVNGEPIRDFSSFVEQVRSNQSDFLTLSDSDGYQVILNKAESESSLPDILARYRVPMPFSSDLEPVAMAEQSSP